MNLALTTFLIAIGIVVGDVAHLERNYLPPEQERLVASPINQGYFVGGKSSRLTAGNCFSERLTQAAPAATLPYPSKRRKYPANESFQRQTLQTFTAPTAFQNLPAPVQVPAPEQRLTNAQIRLPSRQYVSPEVETVEPIEVQQSLSEPVRSYSAPARLSSSAAYTAAAASQSDTKYSADGGYVY